MPADEPRSQRQHKDFRVGERVLIQETNKRTTQDIKGQIATVTALTGNGWVMAKLPGDAPAFRIQQRYLCHAPMDAPALGNAAPELAKSPALAGAALPHRPLKVRIIAPPSDARPSSAPGGGGADAGGGAAASTRGDPGGTQQAATPKSPAATPSMLREVLRKLRADMMEAEAHVPWSAVRSMWRSRRAKWRQSTKSAETVPDLAHRLSEFRNALVTDSSFAGCGPTWQQSLEACMLGNGTHAVLLGVWEELRQSIGAWLDVRQRPAGQQSAALQAGTARAVAALQRAALQGPDAMAQVPLEAILNNSLDGLQAVRTLLEKERKTAASEMARLSASPEASTLTAADGAVPAQLLPPLSPRGGLDGGLSLGVPQDDFDSGAKTDDGTGSCVTDMNLSSDED